MRVQIVDTASGRKINIVEAAAIRDVVVESGQRADLDDGGPIWSPPADMPDITDGQFGRGLWEDGVIPYDEYIGFIGAGILPSTLEALLVDLPDDDTGRPTPRKIARGDLMGRTRFIFANPLVETVRQLMAKRDPIWTPAHLRERWLVWSGL